MTADEFLAMPPPIPSQLVPGRDIDIIACQRKVESQNRVFGVRWAARPDLEVPRQNPVLSFPSFPLKGFIVLRRVNLSDEWEHLNNGNPFSLPRSTTWFDFQNDANNREPDSGPWFPDIRKENLVFLLPLLQLVDPRVSNLSVERRVLDVAKALGDPHEADPELAIRFWRNGAPPPLEKLLADPAKLNDLVRFYASVAMNFLLGLSLRFEFAVLLGLATDDLVRQIGVVDYKVQAYWNENEIIGIAESDPGRTNKTCDPGEPSGFVAETHPGFVRYPHIASFDPVNKDDWRFPAEMRPEGYEGADEGRVLFSPNCPASFSKLNWEAPVSTAKLLDYNAVLYKIQRFEHADSAAMSDEPELPANPNFHEIECGELYQHPDGDTGILDRPGMDRPLEGWYRYRLWGVDLLGVQSKVPAEAALLHRDELAPPPPTIRLRSEQTLEVVPGQNQVKVDLDLTWEASHDFNGPDAVEFRAAATWIGRVGVPVHLTSVNETSRPGRVKVKVKNLPDPKDRYEGTQLTTPDGTYMIAAATPGTPGQLEVRRARGRVPATGQDGVVVTAASPTATTRVARMRRLPAEPARVEEIEIECLGDSCSGIVLRFVAVKPPLSGNQIGHVYLHLLRASFSAKPTDNGAWALDMPTEADDPRNDTLATWLGLPDPAKALAQSPAILFPAHSMSLEVPVPDDFVAGLLRIDVTAADNKTYIASPTLTAFSSDLGNLTGNESEPAQAIISVRALRPPPLTNVEHHSNRIIWAKGASIYVEHASYRLDWPALGGAFNYEVWRALEGSVLPPAAQPGDLSDDDLRELAKHRPDAFELRSRHIFATRYEDEIPGRVPTRVLYKVRALTQAGVPGPFSGLLGPVHVPDIRRPPAPNLLCVGPPRRSPPSGQKDRDGDATATPSTDDPSAGTSVVPARPTDVEQRVLELVWTRQGAGDGIRYQIETSFDAGQSWQVSGATAAEPAPISPKPPHRFMGRVNNLTPGKPVYCRVRAIRIALDPIDPTGTTTREIVGPPSASAIGRAIGSLRDPRLLQVTYDPESHNLVFVWQNQDDYEHVDIGRRAADQHRFEWIATVEGNSQVKVLRHKLAAGGWTFRLRARGHSRRSTSEDFLVQVP